MAKYDPLIEHLRSASGDRVVLGFSQVEQIIGAELPKTARKDFAWWANSSPTDTHKWSHSWQAAGWRAKVKFADGTVTFTRRAPTPLLDALIPTAKQTVMALVEAAGINVEGWKYSGGALLERPQSNPAYCYNWSFGNLRGGFLLCVWHQYLKEERGRVIYPCDIGTHTRRLKTELARTDLNSTQRSRLNQQLERSENFETAVSNAYYAGKALQLILNVGNAREYDELAEQSSTVTERRLDAEKWYVHSIDGGDALIVRGEPRPDLAEHDRPGDEPPSDPGQDDVWREGQIRRRRGQPEFRRRLLEAYESRCAVTGNAMPDLLEAAHIIPHAEGTDYRESNGLLLRADIHTLYDLHHLSIDDRGEIHLSRDAQAMEDYQALHGRHIRFPVRISQEPAPMNLASRHARFLTREGERIKR